MRAEGHVALSLRALPAVAAMIAGAAGLACATGTAWAQSTTWQEEAPAWVESETPLPTVLRTSGLIPISMPGSSLRFGIDPQSVSVGKDDVIRYVVVATSASGAVNAMQEGVRCLTREVKTYARHSASGGWRAAEGAAWMPLSISTAVTRHSTVIARSGLCGFDGDAGLQRDAAKVLRDLRSTAPSGS